MIGRLDGKSEIKAEAYSRYAICKEFGWDYYTYMTQPPFFIEEILLIMHQEAQSANRQARQIENKAKIKTK